MKTDTEKTIFFAEDFEGSGQYVIENRSDYFKDASSMSTIMYKVGYGNNNNACLISMADGWIMKEFTEGKTLTENKRLLCDFLNEENYRAATHEEFVRVALHQSRRCG